MYLNYLLAIVSRIGSSSVLNSGVPNLFWLEGTVISPSTNPSTSLNILKEKNKNNEYTHTVYARTYFQFSFRHFALFGGN